MLRPDSQHDRKRAFTMGSIAFQTHFALPAVSVGLWMVANPDPKKNLFEKWFVLVSFGMVALSVFVALITFLIILCKTDAEGNLLGGAFAARHTLTAAAVAPLTGAVSALLVLVIPATFLFGPPVAVCIPYMYVLFKIFGQKR